MSVALLLCLTLVACGQTGADVNTAPPSGWQDITPPDSGQITHYVASPDIPGLIFALIAGRSPISAAPPQPARLWRSMDNGARWEMLDSIQLRASATLIMPRGGQGLVVAMDDLSQTYAVSSNEGGAWRTVPVTTAANNAPTREESWLAGAVMRNGRLYAGGVAHGWNGLADGTSRFSVSDDHGVTWKPVETGTDPAGANSSTLAIAPLESSPDGWIRLVTPGVAGQAQAILERSTDGGVTWRIVGPMGPTAAWLGGDSAQLATDPTHPNTICSSFSVADWNTNGSAPTSTTHTGMLIAGPPAPIPLDFALFSSADAGQTWHGSVIAKLRGQYGYILPVGLQMDTTGACYLPSVNSSGFFASATHISTLWRLKPDQDTAAPVFTMTDRTIEWLAIVPATTSQQERILASTRISGPGDGQPISCGQGCTTTRDAGIWRLIWRPI